MPCPDENLIARYVQGLAAPAERASVEAHVDRCADCTLVVSEMARMLAPRRDVSASGSTAFGPTIASTPPAAAVDPLPAPGSYVGRYVVEGPLGAGAMGVVLAAIDPQLGRRVALKVIRAGGGDPVAAAARLLREARAMAQLSHPNVVQVFDAGMIGGDAGARAFLAMEVVPGTTLAEWLRTPREWRAIVQRFLEAGEGLLAAHRAGLLHRDFKPANVLVPVEGPARVGDFGLSILPGSLGADLRSGRTMPGAIVGTPGYMAPEQLFGAPVDASSDAFSFCASLYEALFRVRPFEAPSIEALRWRMHEGPATAPPRSDVPPGVVAALMRGLARRKEERPALAALLVDLRAALDGGVESLLRVHAIAQGIAAAMHVAFGLWFFGGVAREAAHEETRSRSSGGGGGSLLLGAFIVSYLLLFVTWMAAGPFWAAANAYAFATRRRWARVSALVYAVFGGLACLGIPYTVFALVTLLRSDVRRYFAR